MESKAGFFRGSNDYTLQFQFSAFRDDAQVVSLIIMAAQDFFRIPEWRFLWENRWNQRKSQQQPWQ